MTAALNSLSERIGRSDQRLDSSHLGGRKCRILSQSVARHVAGTRLGERKCSILFRSVPCHVACLRARWERGDASAGLQRGSTVRAAAQRRAARPAEKRPKAPKSGQNRENRPKRAMRKLAKPAKNGQKRPEAAKNGPKNGQKRPSQTPQLHHFHPGRRCRRVERPIREVRWWRTRRDWLIRGTMVSNVVRVVGTRSGARGVPPYAPLC